MKKNLMVALGIMIMLLVGCAAPQMIIRSTPLANANVAQASQAGWVPVHIVNPSLLSQEVCLFEGSTSVQVIPDARGGWKYSRPAFACYQVGGANSENNWYEYAQIYLPRNFSFIAVSRINGIWGKGNPYFQYSRTGSDPFAITYTSVTPVRRYVNCGALVHLQRQPSSVQQLNIQVDLDFRSIGAAIANGLTGAIYGR